MSACLASSKAIQRTAALPRSVAHTARPAAHVVMRGRVVLARAEPTKQEVQPVGCFGLCVCVRARACVCVCACARR